MEIEEKIKNQISSNNVLLYMKGTPQFPMCGFSANVVNILLHLKTEFSYVNVLENPDIRATLPKVANWPTFPQLYIQGELIGGSDIISEQFESGDLLKELQQAEAISEEAAASEA